MANYDCLKCEAIQEFIQAQRDNPPAVSFKVEQPIKNILEGVQAILDRKTILDLAGQKAIRKDHRKDLKKYLELRRING